MNEFRPFSFSVTTVSKNDDRRLRNVSASELLKKDLE